MLEISNIDVYYGDFQALWDVSLAVGDGEIVTLIGSNGAGKSTILKTISGLLKPKTGSITYDGIRLNRLPAHKIVELGICMVPEGRRLFPQMSVLENLEVGAFLSQARQVKGDTLNWVYEIFPVLRERAKQPAGTLSGGEQQMLAIARGLMSQPKLLLLDEMSLGLGPLLVQDISRVISEINKLKGITIFLVEQNVRLALALADRGYILENGRIVDQGDAKVLWSSDSVKNAYLGVGPVTEKG
ncbi:MAG: ABC transporter ATP-binding protein [Dehalococcoidia bacterium]|nr:ABC transporter ATP-binding protein [Dehalococcoidia bacterium]